MKKSIFLLSFLSITVVCLFTSCKKDNPEITCHLSKSNSAPSDMPIVFKALNTGDGTISTLTYQVGAVVETLTSPSLPWSVEVDALAGDTITIIATGKTKEGSLTISYDGKNETDEIIGEDHCSQSSK